MVNYNKCAFNNKNHILLIPRIFQRPRSWTNRHNFQSKTYMFHYQLLKHYLCVNQNQKFAGLRSVDGTFILSQTLSAFDFVSSYWNWLPFSVIGHFIGSFIGSALRGAWSKILIKKLQKIELERILLLTNRALQSALKRACQ